MPYQGELAALLTAVFWTTTALAYESASNKVGPLVVNMIRLVMAFILLFTFTIIYRGIPLSWDATPHAWLWLSVSGLIGFVFGDYCLFKSYTILNSRIAMLIMTMVPPITAIIGYLFLNESMSLQHIAGMVLTLSGIAIAILNRPSGERKVNLKYPVKGVLYAMGGAIGQAVGLIFSKYGMGTYDAFAASHIRIIAGMVGFALIVVALRKTSQVVETLKNKKVISSIALGSVFGPFLGVSLSLIAIKHTSTGIASTLMSIVPVLIIAPYMILYKQKISTREILGAVVSVLGVVLFFV
jgi:drug/metabolite transporter (DMT)-like permease